MAELGFKCPYFLLELDDIISAYLLAFGSIKVLTHGA
jgi:hypothetical protein